jgi:adenylosuccinate synthase
MVIDPDVFRAEVSELQKQGLLLRGELRVSLDAHVIFPFHRALDGAREDFARGSQIGTTRRGIGPAYESKAARRGIRIRDLLDPERLGRLLESIKPGLDAEFERLNVSDRVDVAKTQNLASEWAKWLAPMVCDAGAEIAAAIAKKKSVLIEGAQGALLDVDHGTYPFVTSTHTVAGGACTGLGIGPTAIDEVWGITKAYATRVGAGPFPTKLHGEAGEKLRTAGAEFGATTGRPRDCGWLDLPALRYAARINGLTGLCVTKLDVVAMLPEFYVCTAYEDGIEPGRDRLEDARPIYQRVQGWGDAGMSEKIQNSRRLEDLPAPVRAYLDLVAQAVGVPVTLVSCGPDREQTIVVTRPFA